MENCKQNIGIEIMKRKYPSLEYVQRDNECIFVGEIVLNHVYNDVRMTGKFDIEIVVPRDFPLALPTVKELSNYIDDSYTHRYPNGYLCLASNLELKMYISKNHDISDFVDKYVIPYLYTYKYFKEYGIYPYGERSHGTMGDLEYLKDLFCVDNWKQVFDIIMFITKSTYRGHLLCLLMLSLAVMIPLCHADMKLPGYLSWNVPFDGADNRPITEGISSYIHALPAL